MTEFKAWLLSTFVEPSSLQTVIAISMAAAFGLLLGKIKIGKVSLGMTFVFFVGILMGHLGVRVDEEMITFAMNFGLILFVYALGLEVGPSFFPSLKQQGIIYIIYSLALIFLGFGMSVLFHYLFNISIPNILGVMSGAVTNTPMLAAVQSTVSSNGGSAREVADLALACAVAYPLGAVGVILALMVLNNIKPRRLAQAPRDTRKPKITEFIITKKEHDGKTVKDLVIDAHIHFIISRIWREERVLLPTAQTKLREGDHLLILSQEEDVPLLREIIGAQDEEHDWNRPDIDWDSLDSTLAAKRIIITRGKINGVKLGALRLRNEYGINITRIDRAGIELLPSPDLYLQLGDRLTVVGESSALSQVAKLLGDQIEMLHKPKLISFFIGMCLGSILGLIPFYIPGISLPIKLGLAGGPIIMGILMGAFGPRLHIATYLTNSATQIIKQIGIITYFAGLGLSSGEHFLETILQGEGFLWIALGFLITILPTLVVGVFCTKIRKMNFGETAGLLAGAMANPIALDYAQGITSAKHASVAYATVYPVMMFTRIIVAQLILMFFLA